jgi:DNA-binding NarL/FixJ family response regulator
MNDQGNKTKIRVIIAEDQEDIRMALQAYVSFDPQLECLNVFSDGLSAWDWISKTNEVVDVALLDIDMPGLNGIELVEKIKDQFPKTQCLMCTIYEDSDRIFKALEAGANGYLLKKSSAPQILEAVREIYNGGAPMSSEIARRVVQSFNARNSNQNQEIQPLSPREMEIVKQLEKGFLYKEIASTLNISVETVRRHVHNIYEKLHVSNRTEALNKLAGKF